MTTITNRQYLEEFASLLVDTNNIGWDRDPLGRQYWGPVCFNIKRILEVRGVVHPMPYAGTRPAMFLHMAYLLINSFEWSTSPQRREYWQEVHAVLISRAEGTPPPSKQTYEEFLI